MGQCVTIEVAPNTKQQSQSQIANHQRSKSQLSAKGGHGGRGRASSKKRGAQDPLKKKAQREESSDEETSDEEMDHLHGADNPYANDPNFGKQQSPINLVTCSDVPHCVKPMAEEEFERNPLRFNYPDQIRGCTVMNTGHTVQVNIPDHSKCSLYIRNKTYQLKQFHFHTPSEHTIDNKQYEMEMHLVHVNDDGEIAVLGFIFTTKQQYFQPTLKLTKSRRYLVKKSQRIISGFGGKKEKEEDPVHQDIDNNDESDIDTDDDYDDDAEKKAGGAATSSPGNGNAEDVERRSTAVVQGNDFLEQFWDQLPLKKTEQDVLLNGAISFDYLFETAAKTFKKSVETNEITIDMEIFEYAGSLTTPPFTEGVHWMVSRQTHFISVKQLNKLSSCWGHHNNAREVQQMHGRQVQMRNQSSMKGYFFN